MRFKKNWLAVFIFGLLAAAYLTAVVVIDIRPTPGIRRHFFRYYRLERLSRYTKLLDPFFSLIFRPVGELAELEITVSSQDAQTMAAALPEPYAPVFLDNQYAPLVPAEAVIDGQKYDGQVKVRGKSPRHWSEAKKSLRLDILGENYPDGVRVTHFVIPWDRGYLFEKLSSQIAKSLDLAVSRNELVTLSFNGQKGVYISFENQDNNLVERNALPAGNIYTEVELGSNQLFPFLFGGVDSWRLYQQEDGVPPDFSDIEQLLFLVNEADEQTFVKQIPTLIDIDQFLRWQAHSTLLSSDHQDDRHNMRLLRNSASGKLTFIPTDTGLREYSSVEELTEVFFKGSYNSIVRRVLKHEPWKEQRDEIIRSYLADHRQELIDLVQQERRRLLPWLMRDSLKLHSNLRVWWMTRRREKFFKNHWDLLDQMTQSQS